MATEYVPIDCGFHDHLEVHAMRGDLLDVEYVDAEGRPRTLEAVRLVTLLSKAGEEIGIFAASDGARTPVRLDHLRSVEDLRTARRVRLPAPAAANEETSPASRRGETT